MLTKSCAWCNKELPPVESKRDGESHGICEDCKKKVLADYKKWAKEHPKDRREMSHSSGQIF